MNRTAPRHLTTRPSTSLGFASLRAPLRAAVRCASLRLREPGSYALRRFAFLAAFGVLSLSACATGGGRHPGSLAAGGPGATRGDVAETSSGKRELRVRESGVDRRLDPETVRDRTPGPRPCPNPGL
jgi:hypothetical protein